MVTTATMSTSEVMSLRGVASLAAARVWLRRAGIAPVGRNLDGEKLWPHDQVIAAHQASPGRGRWGPRARPEES